eukprot:GHUV01014781.1.p1 GENE.GHUV01014781.1~~GHUV01014781.1.p1  ORF type:complete len:297 (+),score=86.88 GHUV01014781.1:958-1848(+)
MTHALSTEAEEVMGLLLGDLRGSKDSLVAHVRRAVPQIRTDRRKDRVETSPEQMAACSALAEHVTSSMGVPTRVVGWYHSHPHITVLPSHVDVNTQAIYQMLDAGFIGLIISVFNTNSTTKEQTVQMTAFQSEPGSSSSIEGCSSADLEGLDSQTQAAMIVSAADMQESAANNWQRREVPLVVESHSNNPSTLSDYVEVQKMLLAEELQAHRLHSSSSSQPISSNIHQPLLQLHDASLHQQALLQHAECCAAPALAMMRQLASQADLQMQQLEAENQRLQGLLASLQGQEVSTIVE